MSYYDPDDPWSELLEPEISQRFRAALEREFDARLRPFDEAEEDRAFAQDEARMRQIYGAAYDRIRPKLLNFAVEQQIVDLESAFHAYRGSQNADSTASPVARASNGRFAPASRQARIEELRLKPDVASQGERRALELEAREDGERAFEKQLRDANRADRRQEQLRDINQAADIKNRQRTERTQLGHSDEAPQRFRDREELDLIVEDSIRAANDADRSAPQMSE